LLPKPTFGGRAHDIRRAFQAARTERRYLRSVGVNMSDSAKLDAKTLAAYSQAAIQNAEALHAEAAVLNQYGHWARGYFLAVACIEEIGKSLMAFDAKGRNLSDPAVVTKLTKAMNRSRIKDKGSIHRFHRRRSPKERGTSNRSGHRIAARPRACDVHRLRP
jgi:AbiV family abortive infection protein